MGRLKRAKKCSKHSNPSERWMRRIPSNKCRECWRLWYESLGDTPAKRLETFHHPDHLERP